MGVPFGHEQICSALPADRIDEDDEEDEEEDDEKNGEEDEEADEGEGAVTHQHLRRSLVYQRTASGWQMIASAISVIPYADLEPQPVDPKVLDTYLGVWQDTPAPSTVTLTWDGRKLMAQGSNETEKTELLAQRCSLKRIAKAAKSA